jgi:transposase
MQPVEKEFLEECLAEGISLEAIGQRAGKHESTVSYWLKKHGLEASKAERHAAKGAPDEEELARLLASGMSLRDIAKRMERSLGTIRHWIRHYELTPPPKRKRGSEDGPREVVSRCRRHGSTDFVREGSGYYRCKRCRAERVAGWRRNVKRRLVEEAGGRCLICGYDRCQRVLQFHHLDPSTKQFQLGHSGVTRSLARSRAEARKCVLLCANCHGEVEAGIASVPLDSVLKAGPG